MFPAKYDEGAWVLDTGATNHMTGCRSSLADLDESVRGAVKFGDGSTVEICGVGAVTMAGKNKEHRVLTEVYFIPSLRCNIVSLGQLQEAGCRVEIDKGVLEVFEREQQGSARGVLIRAERRNRLYVMKVNLIAPICLLTKMEEEAWRWHARFGHLNFRALYDLSAKEIVVARLWRVTKASDSMVSLRRLRPSWGGDLALTKGTFLAMLVGHHARPGRLVANFAQAVRWDL